MSRTCLRHVSRPHLPPCRCGRRDPPKRDLCVREGVRVARMLSTRLDLPLARWMVAASDHGAADAGALAAARSTSARASSHEEDSLPYQESSEKAPRGGRAPFAVPDLRGRLRRVRRPRRPLRLAEEAIRLPRRTSGDLGQARVKLGQPRSSGQSRSISGNLASSEPVRPRPRHSASIAASLSSTPTPATRGEGYECSGVQHIFSRVGVRRPAIPHLGLDIGGRHHASTAPAPPDAARSSSGLHAAGSEPQNTDSPATTEALPPPSPLASAAAALDASSRTDASKVGRVAPPNLGSPRLPSAPLGYLSAPLGCLSAASRLSLASRPQGGPHAVGAHVLAAPQREQQRLLLSRATTEAGMRRGGRGTRRWAAREGSAAS